MSFITMGFGGTAALVLTLGFSSAPVPQGGSYVTLGYGQTASKVAMLGLQPGAPAQGGSYITFGQGQSASKFAMLGLTPGAALPPVTVQPGAGGSIRFPVGALDRARLQRDDELILFVISGAVATGMLN